MPTGITVVQRQCLALTLPIDHCETNNDLIEGDIGGIEGEVCVCMDDKCNSAHAHRMGILGLVVTTMLCIVWSKTV